METKLHDNMTAQEVFDYVCTHLRKQNQKSRIQLPDGKFICAYRGDNGHKCAVGCVITDEQYMSVMESSNMLMFLWIPIIQSHKGLLQELQTAHDCYNVDEWENRFQLAAAAKNLVYSSK